MTRKGLLAMASSQPPSQTGTVGDALKLAAAKAAAKDTAAEGGNDGR
jgi:hypothetical protein